jgi:hypothetical protein
VVHASIIDPHTVSRGFGKSRPAAERIPFMARASTGVLDGNGDDSFQSPLIYDTDAPSVLAVAADVNGDGKPDRPPRSQAEQHPRERRPPR